MRIDVSEILKEPGLSLPFDVKGTVGDIARPDGDGELSVLTVRGVATSLGQSGVYIEANVRGSVTLTCSRCLTSFQRPIDLSCEAKFTGDVLENRDEADDDDDVEVFPLEGTFCDLDEMIRHEIVLSLPMKPLCSEECKGLCPICGTNLNDGTCDCAIHDSPTTAFGHKLLEALEERGKKDGRP